MNLLIDILFILLNVVWWIVIIQAVMSWLIAFNVINTYNDGVRMIWDTLERMTEPLYRPIRRLIKPVNGLDLSPLAFLVLLMIVQRVLIELKY